MFEILMDKEELLKRVFSIAPFDVAHMDIPLVIVPPGTPTNIDSFVLDYPPFDYPKIRHFTDVDYITVPTYMVETTDICPAKAEFKFWNTTEEQAVDLLRTALCHRNVNLRNVKKKETRWNKLTKDSDAILILGTPFKFLERNGYWTYRRRIGMTILDANAFYCES